MLQRLDNQQLVLRRDAAEGVNSGNPGRELRRGHRLELPPFDDAGRPVDDTDGTANRLGGGALIAGDHHGPQPCAAQQGNGAPDSWRHRVREGDESLERQIGQCRFRRLRHWPRSHREHPET